MKSVNEEGVLMHRKPIKKLQQFLNWRRDSIMEIVNDDGLDIRRYAQNLDKIIFIVHK